MTASYLFITRPLFFVLIVRHNNTRQKLTINQLMIDRLGDSLGTVCYIQFHKNIT